VPAAVAAVLTGLLHSACSTHVVPLEIRPAAPCQQSASLIDWVGPISTDHVGDSRAWCESVGPPVFRAPPMVARERPTEQGLVVVSWNVHEGAGDLVRIVNWLRPADVVVIVQEAVRSGAEVPETYPAAVRPPRRESAQRAPVADIVDVADALGLWLAYVPSMRNGSEVREDRGCAILSTVPLSDPTAIELPWVAQRRVAVMATVGGTPDFPRLRVLSAHLDNRPGRRDQAAALGAWLAKYTRDGTPLVVGADLNTWFGAGEETVEQIARAVPLVKGCDRRPTFRFGLRLDYLFTSAANVVECEVGADSYGSDHHPLVMLIENW
jgi:endonuclease/exonuclease/phosphatase family metal-dependent hydrolase